MALMNQTDSIYKFIMYSFLDQAWDSNGQSENLKRIGMQVHDDTKNTASGNVCRNEKMTASNGKSVLSW